MIAWAALAVIALMALTVKKAAPKTVAAVGRAASFANRFKDAFYSVDTKGVPLLAALAVSALETGFGTGKKFQQSNNLFSLKAGSKWHGPTVPASDGGAFRVYASWAESIADWCAWLSKSNNFKKAYAAAQAGDADGIFRDFQNGGYAGADKEYYAKLTRTFKGFL